MMTHVMDFASPKFRGGVVRGCVSQAVFHNDDNNY